MGVKRWLIILTLVLTMIVTVGCGSANNGEGSTQAPSSSESSSPSPDSTSEALVGVVVPLTGSSAKMGQDLVNAINMAFEEVNEAGGVLGGKQLRMIVEDDACDPQTSVAAVNKVINSGVIAVIGHYCSSAALPAKPIYARHNVAAILPDANASQLYKDPVEQLTLINATADHQANTAVKWLTEKNQFKRIAIVHDNTAYSKDLAELTRANLEGKAEVVAFEAITPGEKDFAPVIASLKSKHPDAVFFTGYYAEGGLIVKQAKAAGLNAHILLGDGCWDTTLIEIAGKEAAEGVTVLTTATAEFLPTAKEFIEKYRQKYNMNPGPYSAHAYDAAMLLVKAIEKAGSLDRAAIVKAVRQVSMDGLTGRLEFKEDGTLKQGFFLIQEVKDGKFVLKWSPVALQ